MSGKNKKGKGKSKDQENDGAGAFSVDFGQEKGKDIYIPGSFWGLAGDGASKMWKCSVFHILLAPLRLACPPGRGCLDYEL